MTDLQVDLESESSDNFSQESSKGSEVVFLLQQQLKEDRGKTGRTKDLLRKKKISHLQLNYN